MKVILADDHVMFRRGLKSLLANEGYEVVREASDGYEAVEAAAAVRPDVAILDFNLPILHGIESAREILSQGPHTAIILLTRSQEEALVLEAIRAGIRGYVLKSQAPNELLPALHAVINEGVYVSPLMAKRLAKVYASEGRRQRLSDRERRMLRFILG